jgi:B3 DNA binding domain
MFKVSFFNDGNCKCALSGVSFYIFFSFFQMIPRKFQMNLPHKLPKLATLFSPIGKFWHVETSHIGQDMYFQKGWSEFAKVHDLQTGYFLVFRYEGNMIFKVKIFDTTCCLKDYTLGSHARHVNPCIKIETSSKARDQTSSEKSHGQLYILVTYYNLKSERT